MTVFFSISADLCYKKMLSKSLNIPLNCDQLPQIAINKHKENMPSRYWRHVTVHGHSGICHKARGEWANLCTLRKLKVKPVSYANCYRLHNFPVYNLKCNLRKLNILEPYNLEPNAMYQQPSQSALKLNNIWR